MKLMNCVVDVNIETKGVMLGAIRRRLSSGGSYSLVRAFAFFAFSLSSSYLC